MSEIIKASIPLYLPMSYTCFFMDVSLDRTDEHPQAALVTEPILDVGLVGLALHRQACILSHGSHEISQKSRN
jgi:hypothetical protein